MDEKDYKHFKKVLKTQKEKVTKSKESSQEFLIKAGVFNDKGNLKKDYRHLCIPGKEA
jgi:hypothetical protein